MDIPKASSVTVVSEASLKSIQADLKDHIWRICVCDFEVI